MNMRFAAFLFLLICFGLPSPVTGYGQDRKPFDPLKDDITALLPPLNVLIDSALVNDPELKYATLQIRVNKGNLRNSQAQWTQSIGLQANLGYGTFDYMYNNTLGGPNPSTFTTDYSQLQYGFGAFFRIPFYDMVSRRNQIQVAKSEIAQAQSLVEVQQNVVREKIMRQYNDLVMKQRLLKIKSKYFETSKINMKMAETAFVNGSLPVDEYSKISEIEARTESDYETARTEFLTAYMTLELSVGMKFNLNN
jgi:outer membrane protein TolC